MQPNTVITLVKPHRRILVAALIAAFLESAVGLLGPWPLKVVFDSVFDSHPLPGWLQSLAGQNKTDILLFAAIAALVLLALLPLLFRCFLHSWRTLYCSE